MSYFAYFFKSVLFFLELKLDIKEGTANEITHLNILNLHRKIKQKKLKLQMKKMSKAIEESKQIKILVSEFSLY